MKPLEMQGFSPGGVKYRTIVADPPWPITQKMGAGGRRARATTVPYAFMMLDAILALDVAAAIVADAAHLYLWSTRHNFREGIAVKVARAWGFEPCGELIWGLRNPGMGGFNGNGHEPILLASCGGLPWPTDALPHGVSFWKQPYGVGKIHSAKPDALLDLVEATSPGPYLELFARRQRLGWDTWGNEALEHVQIGEVAP